ncbi:polycomb group RING finger protein 6 isoform X2 [Callorhinchus milii]|uniref:polycomb group RING finger protein 6 isoform X2 n=1 Tax=Callorhinchus milii TaxID=7868 RepID=UPI001C3F6F42|nr:polycomb group RING finger protein 6 isoform X2 [Callorhinchus milii]
MSRSEEEESGGGARATRTGSGTGSGTRPRAPPATGVLTPGSYTSNSDPETWREGDCDRQRESVCLADVNPYILCPICGGYFIDATTITECLHTFCKSCIVKHFDYSNRCPKCNLTVHQTWPLYNIRLDRKLQDIVYKLVPNLESSEKKRLLDFYRERGLEVPRPVLVLPDKGKMRRAQSQSLSKKLVPVLPLEDVASDLDICLVLEFIGADLGVGNYKPLQKKFVRVSGEATVRHVEKFIRKKLELEPVCQVDIICGNKILEQHETLRHIRSNVAHSSIRDGLLILHYGLVRAHK